MPHILWTPWRDLNEILNVRGQLYPSPGTRKPDLRRKACDQISAWKLRGNLPHAVESTWYLTDATLTDNIKSKKLTPLAIRACYSTAFCRFVTGLVDSEQDARYKIPMYVKAKQIGLPASFVELRHEATHGDLPSLVVLRRAAEKALEWIWNDYWQFLDVRTGNLDEDELSAFKDGREKLKEDFRTILRAYVLEISQAAKTKNISTPLVFANVANKASLEIEQICKGERLAISELVKVLLEYKILIPSSKILGRHMDEWFPMWDGLVKILASQLENFLPMLTDEMVIHIISPSFMDVAIDTYREAITMWLIHIYTAKEWAPTTKNIKLNDNSILSSCLQNPNHWTLQSATAIVNARGHKAAKEIYGERITKLVAEHSKSKDPIIRSTSLDHVDRLLPSQRALLETEGGLKEQRMISQHDGANWGEESELGGWEKWKGAWISRPIGLV